MSMSRPICGIWCEVRDVSGNPRQRVRIKFKSKAVVHFDQHKAALRSASLADNCTIHTVAIDALTVFDVVYTHPLLAPTSMRRNGIHLRSGNRHKRRDSTTHALYKTNVLVEDCCAAAHVAVALGFQQEDRCSHCPRVGKAAKVRPPAAYGGLRMRPTSNATSRAGRTRDPDALSHMTRE